MIHSILLTLVALLFIAAAALIAWIWRQREPAGHGRHAQPRQALTITEDDLPCYQPDPALVVHHDVPWPHADLPALDARATGGDHQGREPTYQQMGYWQARTVAVWQPHTVAPWVEMALEGASREDTVIDSRHKPAVRPHADYWEDRQREQDKYTAWLEADRDAWRTALGLPREQLAITGGAR